MAIVLQNAEKQGFFVISVRNSGEIESEFYYRLCKTKPILERMNANFCATGYYEGKQKAVEKPPLVEFTIFRVSGYQEKMDLA